MKLAAILVIFMTAGHIDSQRTGSYVTLKDLGCWRDHRSKIVRGLEGRSDVLNGHYKTRGDAVQKCARAAMQKGYRVFVMQDGGWCGSSFNAREKYFKLGKSTGCRKDGEGGYKANQVYEIVSSVIENTGHTSSSRIVQPEYVFGQRETQRRRGAVSTVNRRQYPQTAHDFILNDFGCWALPSSGIDSMEGRNIATLDGHYRYRMMAVQKCAKAVAEQGNTIFALHDGGKCLVVTDVPAITKHNGRRKLCSYTGKGSRSSLQVYEIRYSKTRVAPRPMATSSTTTTTPLPTYTIPYRRVTRTFVAPTITEWYRPTADYRRTVPTPRPTSIVRYSRYTTLRSTPRYARYTTSRPSTRYARYTTLPPTTRYARYTTTRRTLAWESRTRQRTEKPKDYLPLINLGCWRYAWNDSIPSLEKTSSLLDGHYSQRSNAVEKCAKVAMKMGYDVIAIQDGGKCASSNDARRRFAKLGQSSHCRDDGKGGSWVNQVYEVGIVWDVRIGGLGCYESSESIQSLEGTINILDGEYYRRKDAIRKCAKVATIRGYQTFAIQDGGKCLGSSDMRTTGMTIAANTCARNGKGGFNVNEVYEIVSVTKIKLRSLGCWRDQAPWALLGMEQTHAELMENFKLRKDALGKCARAAKQNGFRVFGLQNGGWCGGSRTSHTTYTRHGKSDLCNEDGEGGMGANQIYEIVN